MNQEEVGGEGNEEKRGRGWILRVTRGDGGGEGDMEMGRRMRRRGEGRRIRRRLVGAMRREEGEGGWGQ